ncbi:MAG: HAD family hydrolase [Beduini sp.]
MKDILFDLDGTITDPMLGITKSVAYALKYFEIEVKDLKDLIPFIGPPLVDSFQEFYHFNKEQANIAVVKYREYFKETGIFENEPYQGIEQILKSLIEKGYRLSIATSKPHVFASRILEHFNLIHYFSNVYGSELDGTRNAKGEVIAYALNDLKCDPKKTIMVGDRKHDVIGAHENHLKCIGVLYGYGSLEEFDSCHADYVVDSVEALYELLISLD